MITEGDISVCHNIILFEAMASNPKRWFRKIFPTNRRLLVERSLKNLNLSGCKRVLVVGAGYDPYGSLFEKTELYLRLDIDSQGGVVDLLADAHALPFEKKSFDCILAVEVFEHLQYPTKFVEEVDRVLERRGVFIVSVPFLFHQHGDPCDYWRPTRFTLENLFSGFAASTILTQGNRLHVILDLLTTSFPKYPVFIPLRLCNHVVNLFSFRGEGTAPSGFFVFARK